MATDVRCPVISISEEVMFDAVKLQKSLQRLGKALAGCEMCQAIDCQLQAEINRQVEEAIRQVSAEWKVYG